MLLASHSSFRNAAIVVLLSTLGIVHAARSQTVHHVDASATGANDGTSWLNAFVHLQDALASGQAGDEVWVARGVYFPDLGAAVSDDDPMATFQLWSGVAVYGGFSGDESERQARDTDPATNGTILSGDIGGDDGTTADGITNDPSDIHGTNSLHVVTATSGVSQARLDGFTITGGAATGVSSNPLTSRGGGIYVSDAAPHLDNLLVVGSTATVAGGGLYAEGPALPTFGSIQAVRNNRFGLYLLGPALGDVLLDGIEVAENENGLQVVDLTVTIQDALVRDNQGVGIGLARATATVANSVVSGNTSGLNGAGIQNILGTLAVRNSTISGNTSTRTDAEANGGGGIYNNGSLVVALTVIEGNRATSRGGGLYNAGQAAAIVVGSLFIGNEADVDGGGVYSALGDDTQLLTTNLELYNSFFLANSAGRGGAVFNNEVLETMNLVFSGNNAQGGGALFNEVYGRARLRNVTASGNTADEAGAGVYNRSSANSAVTIHNSVFWGNTAPNQPALFTTFGGSFDPVAVGHSLLQGGLPAMGATDLGGNLDADPVFADPDGSDGIVGTLDDDLRLTQGSPAIDAGNNEWVPQDVHDVDGNGDTEEPWPVDIGDPPSSASIEPDFTSDAGVSVSDAGQISRPFGHGGRLLPEERRILGLAVDPGAYETSGSIVGPSMLRSSANYRWAGIGGDPVSTFTGELFFTEDRLLHLGGPLPVFFQPYYASFLEIDGRLQSRLGPNWSHNFDARLIMVDATTIEAVNSRGRITTFEQQGATWEQISGLDEPWQLVQEGTSYLLGNPRSGTVQHFDADGRLSKIEDGRGNALTLTYDAQDRLAAVSDGLGRTLAFSYDDQDRLSAVADAARTVTFTHDQQGRLTGITDTEGATTTYAYDGTTDNLVAATPPNGQAGYTQTFDAEGRVTAQADADGNSWQFDFDGLETSVSDPHGNSFTHAYTSAGQVQTYIDPYGNSVSMAYDVGRRTQITDRLGATTRVTYHAATGFPETITEANGGVTTYSYTARTVTTSAKRAAADLTVYDLTGITLPDGGTIRITRDANGNATNLTNPQGESWSFTYNQRGQVVTETNPEGSTSAYTYNTDATLASFSDGAGNATTFSYDDLRRLTRITRPDGATRTFQYDGQDRLLSATDEEGRARTLVYDESGNRTRVTDPSGQLVQYDFDPMNRLTRITDRTGGLTELSYDALGRLEMATDPSGSTMTYGHDALGRLTSITDGAGNSWQIAYDAEGVPTSITDPNGNAATYATNTMGWVTHATDPLGNATSRTYDSMGRPMSAQDPLGYSTAFQRDALGRLTGTTLPGGAAAGYGRDGLGLMEMLTDPNGESWDYDRDPHGRLNATTDPLNRTTHYTYDSRNLPAHITLPGGGSLAATYDGTGLLSELTYSDGVSLRFDRDDNGRIIEADGVILARDATGRLTVSNGLVLERDAAGRLSSVTYAPGKTVTYAYDGRGLVSSVTDWLDGTTTLEYDEAGRLVSITRPNGITTTYGYDAAGRVLQIEEATGTGKNGAAPLASAVLTRDARGQVTGASREVPQVPEQPPASGVWTVDAAGQIEGSAYDLLGRLESKDGRVYSWNLAGRLASYTEGERSVEFEYDAFGHRTRRDDGTTVKTYLWNYALDLPSVAVERMDETDERYYISTPGGELLYSVDADDGTRQFYHYDEVGNTQVVSDDDGRTVAAYAYSPYGEILGETGDVDNAFTWQGAYGVMRESDDLYYVRARYYDPKSRRFLSPDPIKSLHPSEIAPYQYARGNPQSYLDPTGMKPQIDFEISKDVWWFFEYFLYRLRGRGHFLYGDDDDEGGMVHIAPPSLELYAGPASDELDDLQQDLQSGVLLNDTVIPTPTPIEATALGIMRAGRGAYNALLDAMQASAASASASTSEFDTCPTIDPASPAAYALNGGASYGPADNPPRSTCLTRYYEFYWIPFWIPSYRETRWKWHTWWNLDWGLYYFWWWDYREDPVVSRTESDFLFRRQFQLIF